MVDDADLERRFGGLRRLYGDQQYAQLRQLRVAVVGLGGVGSWAVEALARSGIAALTLIDMDHVAESNINRQVQALGATIGQSKIQALAARVADIHPGCKVHGVDEFVDADNWPGLLVEPVDVVIDACDQVRAKFVLATWSLSERVPCVVVGAAGGKQQASAVEVADLSLVTHDPLLASLRQRLRQSHAAPRGGKTIGVACVFSRETVLQPSQVCEMSGAADGSLNCHGYGSSVMVTATFGMVAAQQAVSLSMGVHKNLATV